MAFAVETTSFEDGAPIPELYAFGVKAEVGHAAAEGGNKNPHLRWSGAPEGTQSFVVLCIDPDVPTVFDDVGVEGKTLSASMPRQDFDHWVLVDLPPSTTEIAEGAASDGITPKGKPTGPSPVGGITGKNDYTMFMAGDPDMGGTYGGYDGPFPPWNDELVHRYQFRVLALDVPTLGLSGDFGSAEVLKAAEGHVLASAQVEGTYTLNPELA
ncbi:MAG: YbhB/YbcL family Raf kinase inhibitor-like protein [Actinomycetota bacterium]|nr:YbhB/YbcL family Raf kinase inhibitor-like protein [Actinomycetota bacterium]